MLEFNNLEGSQPSVNFFSFSIFSQFRRREESLIQRRILTAVTRLQTTRKRTSFERQQSKPVTWCVVLKQLKKKNQEAFKLLWIRKRDNISSSIYKRIVKAPPNTNSTAVILVAFFVHFFLFHPPNKHRFDKYSSKSVPARDIPVLLVLLLQPLVQRLEELQDRPCAHLPLPRQGLQGVGPGDAVPQANKK